MDVQLLVMIALGDVQLHHKEAIRDLNQAKGGSTLEVCKLGRSSWSSRAPSSSQSASLSSSSLSFPRWFRQWRTLESLGVALPPPSRPTSPPTTSPSSSELELK